LNENTTAATAKTNNKQQTANSKQQTANSNRNNNNDVPEQDKRHVTNNK
jgi:hypothetical protein